MFKNAKSKVALASAALVASASSFAQEAQSLSTITDSFQPATIVTGVLAVGVTLAAVYVTIKGARILLGMIRG